MSLHPKHLNGSPRRTENTLLETSESHYSVPLTAAYLLEAAAANDSDSISTSAYQQKKTDGSPASGGLPRSASFKAALNDPQLSKSLQDATPKRSYDDPHSPSSNSKARFERSVRRYYYQLSVGCGDTSCAHKLCASCKLGPRLTPDASAIMAVQLASRPRLFFCPRIPTDPPAPRGPPFSSPSSTPRSSPLSSPRPSRKGSPYPDHTTGDPRSSMDEDEPSSDQLDGESSPSSTLPSRPFLSSLLASSPFASLFNPSGVELGSSTFKRSHSTSELDDVHHDDNISQPAFDSSPTDAIKEQNVLRRGLFTFDDGSVLGLRLLSKLTTDHATLDKSSIRSRSSTDLPSLGSISDRFSEPHCSSTSGQCTPVASISRSNSSGSLPETDTSTPIKPRTGSPLRYVTRAHDLVFSPAIPVTAHGHEQDASSGDEEPQLSLQYLTLPLLKSAVATYRSTAVEPKLHENGSGGDDRLLGDPRFLVNTLRTVFSDSDALNRSFLAETETRHPSGLDISAVREAYELILDVQPRKTFLIPFVNALEILLARLQLNLHRLQAGEPQRLRQILILLEIPLLSDRSYHDSLLKKLCLILGALRAKSRSVLINWYSRYDREGFEKVLKVFHRYLEDHFHPSPQPDEALVAAVRTLSMLYLANENAKNGHIVPVSAFYSESLNRKLNFKDEYKTWKRTLENPSQVTQFSYFNYPFLFDPTAKTRIMHIDAMVQMSLEFEDAFVHQALVVHAQRFLQDSPSVVQLEHNLKQATNPFLVLEIRRQHLVQDALDQIRKKGADLKKPLKVRFIGGGEEGMDQGGVQKEFFQVIVSMLLDPAYGMFLYDQETRYCWINGASLESEKEFELVGTIVGLALYNGVILDVNFPKVLYKKLLDEAPTLEDVKDAWPTLGRGLQQLLEWSDGDVGDVFLRTFEISYDIYGQVKHFPLVEGGEDILVTNDNRKEYVDLYIHHYVVESVRRQFSAFRRGFHKVCGGNALKMCRASELELMICGTSTTDLDFTELEQGAQYDDGYGPDHEVIQWFWEIVHSDMELEQKKKLLNFVTASDRVPLKGLGGLTFVIQRNGPDTDRLPTALTCFGRLLLPEYSDKDKLRDRLVTAIENAKGFGLV
ncbi:uncharacterized protein SPPG_01327 [Spizellomyces punctatus DAOM BR117]|uniref:HECT-type E3 ubiquitin transferase n=1 Tax=Spizellomyces punctatus (strain DAOM BR117) TaxID=645134 RepID=A0A0L0HSI7_SPIPD|nr:uncharacterized protein SPPG_01327 [Spizellomyces punctatus DAOM BR117]KND03875.1 hypothetical protein SPPG_01327 [Spizellomyces punctatus DAOM BR117]|eukprot:XP_016611914.1 hypothetical protein SPPG_01327 [Spizellomyces punctatus DAOM BR117]